MVKVKWYTCPHCGKRILKYDIEKAIAKGLYWKCKNCKKEIEIKINR